MLDIVFQDKGLHLEMLYKNDISESDMYSATINEDYYAEAGVVSKGVSASCN